MTETKLSWVISGSMLLAIVTGLIAVAADDPFLDRDAVVPAPSLVGIPPAPAPTPHREPSAASFNHARAFHNSPTYCPPPAPCQGGRYARFMEHCRAKYWGYPEQFCEPPLGSMVLGHQMVMISNAQAARMGLYQYDFLSDSAQLNSRGKAELTRIAMWLPANDCPVFVEPTPTNPDLNELRRQAVWRELSDNYFAIPAARVIVGRPNVRGLGAIDSLLIDRNRLGLTASRGIAAGGGGTSGTSTTTNTGGGMGPSGR